MDIYDRIRMLRLERGMTQSELAKKTGYSSKSMIAHIEAGNVNLTTDKIEAFASALGVTPSDLMGWTEEAIDEELYSQLKTRPEVRHLLQIALSMQPSELHALLTMAEVLAYKGAEA